MKSAIPKLAFTGKMPEFRRRRMEAVPEIEAGGSIQTVLPLSISRVDLEASKNQLRFTEIRPATLGQAARIPGITPADVAMLVVWLEKLDREAASSGRDAFPTRPADETTMG